MPTINRNTRKKYYQKKDKSELIYKYVYNTRLWRSIREGYIISHPLCEKCLERGKISPTEEVHHVIPISTADDVLKMKELGFDYNNLMALCKDCHHQIHNSNEHKKIH